MPTVETLAIGSVTFPTPGAFEALDLTPLLLQGPARGQDLVIPGADGVLFRAKAQASLTVSVPLLIYGTADGAGGAAPADVRSGLKKNTQHLYTNLLAANVGSLTATVTWPDASTTTGSVGVEAINFGNLNPRAEVLRGVMRVVLLDGGLT